MSLFRPRVGETFKDRDAEVLRSPKILQAAERFADVGRLIIKLPSG